MFYLRVAIRAERLSAGVRGRKIFGDLNFVIECGSLWLVTGDCGTGKSTLAKIIVGLIPELYTHYSTTGFLEVLSRSPVDVLKEGLVTYLPQDISLATLTASAAEELSAYGLSHKVSELRKLVGDLAVRDLRTLSAGERCRVLTALSTLLNKKLLVIDEPSGYLDSTSLRDVLEVLRDYVVKSGATTLVIDNRSRPYVGRVDGVIDLGPRTLCETGVIKFKSKNRGEVLLDVDDLSFSYGSKEIFSNIYFEVEAGGVVAVVGPNGSGKTTLLRLILGLLKPRRGSIRRFYKRAFYVPQTSCYWLDTKSVKVLSDSSVVKLAGVEGLDVMSMSFGEVRRLAMYAGIYSESDLVVVDEVSLGLDTTSLSCVKKMFAEARRAGKGVVFSTHDLDVVRELEPDLVVDLH
ncbi:MAG: ATP-binding cassette domain-containing protein [Sulfolobales archaeon]|nr:ATP-binding cassette domain-containing protein [Sulfolobales archaeon]